MDRKQGYKATMNRTRDRRKTPRRSRVEVSPPPNAGEQEGPIEISREMPSEPQQPIRRSVRQRRASSRSPSQPSRYGFTSRGIYSPSHENISAAISDIHPFDDRATDDSHVGVEGIVNTPHGNVPIPEETNIRHEDLADKMVESSHTEDDSPKEALRFDEIETDNDLHGSSDLASQDLDSTGVATVKSEESVDDTLHISSLNTDAGSSIPERQTDPLESAACAKDAAVAPDDWNNDTATPPDDSIRPVADQEETATDLIIAESEQEESYRRHATALSSHPHESLPAQPNDISAIVNNGSNVSQPQHLILGGMKEDDAPMKDDNYVASRETGHDYQATIHAVSITLPQTDEYMASQQQTLYEEGEHEMVGKLNPTVVSGGGGNTTTSSVPEEDFEEAVSQSGSHEGIGSPGHLFKVGSEPKHKIASTVIMNMPTTEIELLAEAELNGEVARSSPHDHLEPCGSVDATDSRREPVTPTESTDPAGENQQPLASEPAAKTCTKRQRDQATTATAQSSMKKRLVDSEGSFSAVRSATGDLDEIKSIGMVAQSTHDCSNDSQDETPRGPLHSNGAKSEDAWHKSNPSTGGRFPAVEQIKILLYTAATKAHRGRGTERLFSEYWKALSRYVCLGLQGEQTIGNVSLDWAREALDTFLITKRMKSLHNLLILALMELSMKESAEGTSLRKQIPKQWRHRIRLNRSDAKPFPRMVDYRGRSVSPSSTNENHARIQLHDSKMEFGLASDVWSSAGNGELYANRVFALDFDRFPHDEVPTSRVHVPACLPGALVVDPLVRGIAQKEKMKVAENALWLLVVAAREYASSIIKQTIARVDSINSEWSLPELSLSRPGLLSGKMGAVESKKPSSKPTSGTEAKGSSEKSIGTSEANRKRCRVSSLDIAAFLASSRSSHESALGGSTAHLAFERCIYASFVAPHPFPPQHLGSVHDFMTSAVHATSASKRRKVDSASHEPDASMDDVVTKAGDHAESTQLPAPSEQFHNRGRSPVIGLGRGAKNLEALRARAHAAASSPVPDTSVTVNRPGTASEGDSSLTINAFTPPTTTPTLPSMMHKASLTVRPPSAASSIPGINLNDSHCQRFPTSESMNDSVSLTSKLVDPSVASKISPDLVLAPTEDRITPSIATTVVADENMTATKAISAAPSGAGTTIVESSLNVSFVPNVLAESGPRAPKNVTASPNTKPTLQTPLPAKLVGPPVLDTSDPTSSPLSNTATGPSFPEMMIRENSPPLATLAHRNPIVSVSSTTQPPSIQAVMTNAPVSEGDDLVVADEVTTAVASDSPPNRREVLVKPAENARPSSPPRRQGRGFGVKNLAAMMARNVGTLSSDDLAGDAEGRNDAITPVPCSDETSKTAVMSAQDGGIVVTSQNGGRDIHVLPDSQMRRSSADTGTGGSIGVPTLPNEPNAETKGMVLATPLPIPDWMS